MDFVHTEPDISVLETEYQRLLGFPRDYVPEGRVRELMDWAASWYAEKGKPWMYGHAVQLRTEATTLTVGGQPFAPSRLSEQVAEAGAERAALVAVSAGKQCEEHAGQLWREGKPDEYFFLEVFGSAVVEHLVTGAGARLCAWADANGLAVLPHYSPGYSGWDVSEQVKLFGVLCQSNGKSLPGELRVLESGMLQPKKSLLAVFPLTAQLSKARSLANLIPCENCSFSPCQFRRAPQRRPLPQLEDLRQFQDRNIRPANTNGGRTLRRNANYSINRRALQKWAQERLQLEFLDDGSVVARFRYEGTTCSNLGHALEFDYEVRLDSPEQGYRIVETSCRPGSDDAGHTLMCEYINDADGLMRRIATEKPLLGSSLDQVLAWPRPYSPAGCYCDQASRQHKWGLVFEVLHYALAQREAVVAPVALESGPRSNGF